MFAFVRRSVAGACLVVPVLAAAQQPEGFKNLQVLPKDIPRAELLGLMRRFNASLGVQCSHCHVVKNPGQVPEQLDPSLDDKEVKRGARQMLQMTMDINGTYLARTGRTFTPRTRVSCETCHRGATLPRTLAAEVLGALEARDADSAVARYRELREKAYGRAMFDFGEGSLPAMADELTRSRRADDAMKLLRLNLEYFPKSGMTYAAIAMGEAQRGDTTAALATIEQGLAAAPDHPQLKQLLARLKGERPQR